MNKALLVGNDINNTTGNYSWANLIKGLIEYADAYPPINTENKPFPMLYEEIYLNAVKKQSAPEMRIKTLIASQTRNMVPNELHNRILDLGIPNILTTNYDLCFEKTLGFEEKSCKNQGVVQENIYSMFRHHNMESHKIWHIHGSQTLPGSITLGYEHYGGYLQTMRNYVATGTQKTYKYKNFSRLDLRLKKGSVAHHSWVDFFFTHDLHIMGLNLDFVEMHLWWLISYRARLIARGKIPVTNKIYYYYPAAYEERSRHKLEMMRISEIETVRIDGFKDKTDYYKRVINSLKNSGS